MLYKISHLSQISQDARSQHRPVVGRSVVATNYGIVAASQPLAARAGHELKLVYPQPDAPPDAFAGLAFQRFSLQPMDGPELAENTAKAVAYCVAHPQWRLSLQTHKVLGIR